MVDDQGLALSKMEYLPYGETWFEEGDSNNAPKYNSQELDKETGYYFYNARHYDPEISRFVTADNVIDGEGDTQGWNRFSYVKGNPVAYRDPTGHHGLGRSPWITPSRAANREQYNKAIKRCEQSPTGGYTLTGKEDIEARIQLAKTKLQLLNAKNSQQRQAALLKFGAKLAEDKRTVAEISTSLMMGLNEGAISASGARRGGPGVLGQIWTKLSDKVTGFFKPKVESGVDKLGREFLRDVKTKVRVAKTPKNYARILSPSEKVRSSIYSSIQSKTFEYVKAFETTFTPGIPDYSKLVGNTIKETLLKLGAGYAGKKAEDKATE